MYPILSLYEIMIDTVLYTEKGDHKSEMCISEKKMSRISNTIRTDGKKSII